MKDIFLSIFLLLFSSCCADVSQTLDEDDQDDLSLHSPQLSWIDSSSIQVIYPDHAEDVLHLRAADMVAEVVVRCLFDGNFEKETSGSFMVSGCINDSYVYFTIYSSHLPKTTSFIWEHSGVIKPVVNPYTILGNDTASSDDYDFEDDEVEEVDEQRVKRGTFNYYDGEEEDFDLQFDGADGPPPPIPPDLILHLKLAYEESMLEQMNGNHSLAQAYIVEVAAHGSVHMRHSSLGTRIHLQFMGPPQFLSGRRLSIDRQSLRQVQDAKNNQTVPLIAFLKTDDTNRDMGVSWPGYKGGACNQTKGAAMLKWRSNPLKAAMSFSHENGHMTGLFHDVQEDRRHLGNKTCEGSGIMSRGDTNVERPARWSQCSSLRIRKWYPKHGHCLFTAPSCDDSERWSTPCTCGSGDDSVACLSAHAFCWEKHAGDTPYQCLSRKDLAKNLAMTQRGALDQDDKSISSRLVVLEGMVLKQTKLLYDEQTTRINQINNQEKLIKNQEKLITNLIKQLDMERNGTEISSNESNLKDMENPVIEERMNMLEKINVLRSCHELEQSGVNISGYYHLDPDGDKVGHPPIKAYCNFEDHVTEIFHEYADILKIIPHCDSNFCYTQEYTYSAHMDQITSLMEISSSCDQSIEFSCYVAPLAQGNHQLGVWVDRQGQDQEYFHGSNQGRHTCSCDSTNSCTGILQNTCNCDASLPAWMEDTGKLTDMNSLPVMAFKYGPLTVESQQAKVRVGRLRCGGRKEVSRNPHSCRDLKLLGETRPGLYNLQDDQHSNYPKMSFCQLDQPGYGDDLELESYWVKRSSGPGQVFFAVRGNNANDGAVITYDTIVSNEGQAMNPSSGVFTAPVDGVYDLKFSGQGTDSIVDVYLNDTNVIHMHTSSSSQSMNRAWQFKLKQGDEVKLIKRKGTLSTNEDGLYFIGILL